MSEWIKTSLYVVVGAGLIVLAVAAKWFAEPTVSQAFEQLGAAFYPEFDNPLAARSLEVVSFNPETSIVHEFHVNWGDEGWTISPYGYPADAKEQLEKTAASVVGIERAGLASRRASDFEKYGVVGPHNEDFSKQQRGKRIILKDESGQVLLDLIIGDPAEGRAGYCYVRKPKENDTYIAKVDIELSTQFADWINSDLLEMSPTDLQQIRIADYSVDPSRGVVAMRSQSILLKEEQPGGWTLKNLEDDSQELDTAVVNDLTRALAGLKILGVRPKPEGLNADLSIDRETIRNEIVAQLLRQSLSQKGFYFGQSPAGDYHLYGKEGQVTAMTGEGIAYDVYFGEQFTGTRVEIEFGSDQKSENSAESDSADAEVKTKGTTKVETEDSAATSRSDETSDGPEKESSDEENSVHTTGRYLFVTARFAPEQLEKPAPPEPAPEDADKKEHAQAQQAYEQALAEYDQKVADAKQAVKEANERFKEWFYVISTENFEDLRLSRKELLKPKNKKEKASVGSAGMSPSAAEGATGQGTPLSTDDATPAEPAGAASATDPVAAPKPVSKQEPEKSAGSGEKSGG